MALIRRIRNLLSRSKMEREINAELQAHIEMRIEDNLAEGMSREQARRDAFVRFGSPTATKERVAGMDAALGLDSIWSDIRFSSRQLLRNPGFAVVAILVFALGMGASVAIFAFVDAALIRPLPYKDPGRLVSVYEVVNTCPLCNISYMNYQDWKRSDLPFSSIEAWGWASYLLRSSEATEPVQGARVSDGFFHTLGVTPILGRDFRLTRTGPAVRIPSSSPMGPGKGASAKIPGSLAGRSCSIIFPTQSLECCPGSFISPPSARPNSGRHSMIRTPATSGAAVMVSLASRALRTA